MRFVFAGDTHIGERVSKNLVDAGHALGMGVQDADVILTYSISQTALEDMYFDTDGILQLAKEGSCFIDLSPSNPSFGVELYALAQTKNCQAIDAPLVVKDLVNHDSYAHREALGLLVGCEEKVFARYESVLKAIASSVYYAGINGEGQRAKVNQTIMLAGQLVAVFEAWALNSTTRSNPVEAIRFAIQMGLASPAIEAVYTAICDAHFHGTYSARALMAELTAVLHASEESDIMLPQTESAAQMVELFMMAGGADRPVSAVSLVYAEEEDSKKLGLDWDRAQSMMMGKAAEDGHECQCGNDPNDPDHECCGRHHNQYRSDIDYDEDEDVLDESVLRRSADGAYPSDRFSRDGYEYDDYDPYEDEYPSQGGFVD